MATNNSKQTAYRRKAEAQVEEHKAKLDQARAQLKKQAAETRIEAQSQLELLEKKLDAAKTRLKKLADAGEDTWDEIEESFEKAWHEVSASIKGFISGLKK